MTAGHRYSTAPRCTTCGGRALLTRETADAFVAESFGRLEVVECTDDEGWHVWSRDLEKVYAR